MCTHMNSWVHTHYDTHVEVRGKLVVLGSLIQPCVEDFRLDSKLLNPLCYLVGFRVFFILFLYIES